MAYNQELTDRVRLLLARQPNVTETKMFGSIGFKVNNKLCVSVGNRDGHVMLVRVGREAYASALQRKGAGPAIMRDREMKGYVFLTEEAVSTDVELADWLNAALDYNKLLVRSEA